MATDYVPYAGPIVTRAQAKTAGLTRFFTGKPCKHGHYSERTTCNGGCIACNAVTTSFWRETWTPEYLDLHRKRGRENMRQRRLEGKHRAAWLVWYHQKGGKAKVAADKLVNREKYNAAERKARKLKPEQFKARATRYNQTPKGKLSKVIEANRRRQAKLNAEGQFTVAEVKALFARQKGRCVYCATSIAKGYDVDHIVPLARGGTNWITNIQLLCGPCNGRKWAFDPIEYARRLGRLL
jgi:5-methylcytosine-specific restriction endonuclease McrA